MPSPIHNSVDNDNVILLETSHASARALSSTNNRCRPARLCLFKTRAHCPRQTIDAGLLAFVYLKRAGKHRFWLAASGRGSSPHRYEIMRAMCPAVHVSGEVFSDRKRRIFGMGPTPTRTRSTADPLHQREAAWNFKLHSGGLNANKGEGINDRRSGKILRRAEVGQNLSLR
jgi:hypothetical protein